MQRIDDARLAILESLATLEREGPGVEHTTLPIDKFFILDTPGSLRLHGLLMLQKCYHIDVEREPTDANRGRALVMYQLAWPSQHASFLKIMTHLYEKRYMQLDGVLQYLYCGVILEELMYLSNNCNVSLDVGPDDGTKMLLTKAT